MFLIRIDKARLMDLFGLHFIERHENIAFCGPVGVGKSYLAQALGHAACRAGYRVLCCRGDGRLRALARPPADNSAARARRSVISRAPLLWNDSPAKHLCSQGTCDSYGL